MLPWKARGSGCTKSNAAGRSLEQLTGPRSAGQPLGSTGIAVAPAGSVSYALVDAQARAGLSATRRRQLVRAVSTTIVLQPQTVFRGITVDPKNAELVYVPSRGLSRRDGGAPSTVLKGTAAKITASWD